MSFTHACTVTTVMSSRRQFTTVSDSQKCLWNFYSS